MMRHEYPPPAHYPFDPRQQRFMMGNPRHPPIKVSYYITHDHEVSSDDIYVVTRSMLYIDHG